MLPFFLPIKIKIAYYLTFRYGIAMISKRKGKKIAVHLMVLDEWLLSGIEALPDLMSWIIEEIKTKECSKGERTKLFM